MLYQVFCVDIKSCNITPHALGPTIFDRPLGANSLMYRAITSLLKHFARINRLLLLNDCFMGIPNNSTIHPRILVVPR